MVIRRGLVRACVVLCLVLAARAAAGQDDGPAFVLGSNHVFSTREQPAIDLTFRRVSHVDFRVYRVRDPIAFFEHLRDPHTLGGASPLVPQERTWLERLAAWKATTRDRIRAFVRTEFSFAYRRARIARANTQQVQLRRPLRYQAFTQAPLLNPSQLLASWREMLPLYRDSDMRRIPLDLHQPGVYVVEAVNDVLKAYTVVVITDVAIVSKSARGQMLLYVANRFSGEPAAGCDLRVIANGKIVATGTSGTDGTAETWLQGKAPDQMIVAARCGSDFAVADPGSWWADRKTREIAGYVYTDRPVYRPGHTAHIRAILRWRDRGSIVPFDRRQVELTVSDSSDKVLLRQTLPVDEFGSVRTSFMVPPGGALGYYPIRVIAGDETADGGFNVQEYRKPEFDVGVQAAEKFVVQGGTASFAVTARYYFGQPVAGGSVKYVVRRQHYYSPYHWNEEGEGWAGEEWYGGPEIGGGTARLDRDGKAAIKVPLPADTDVNNAGDYSVQLEARVTDASGREMTGQDVVHATWTHVVLTVERETGIQRAGGTSHLEVRTIDYVGRPQGGLKVHVWLEVMAADEAPRAAAGAPIERLPQTEVVTDADGRASWDFTLPKRPGLYAIRTLATVDGRPVRSDATVWIPGPLENVGTYEPETYVQLVPDKAAYQPGETARLMLRGAAVEVPILVTKEAEMVTFHRVMRYRPGDVIEVPVAAEDMGDTWVNVAFMKDDRFYRSEKQLRVAATSRQLQISISADAAVSRPGQAGRFTLSVRDGNGQPVRAQMSVGVVDEALYGVERDSTPSPLRFFYRHEYDAVGTSFSRSYSFVGYSGTQQLLLAQRRRPMALADFKADRPSRPEVRKNFPDAIFWDPAVMTDASGTAQIQVPYPDSLTTWRMTVRAVTTDTLVGSAVGRTITTKDLIVRVITPRFLTEGDEAEVPIVVHNFLPSQTDVNLQTTATGLTPAGSALSGTQSVSIASGGEQRFDPRFKADKVGMATVAAVGSARDAADAMQMSLPVLPFGLKRVASASGSIATAAEASASLSIPDRSNPAARAIRVSLAPSMAGALLGALDYLTSYPYGCTEQTLSSFVPNLVVLRALAQLKLAPTERLSALDRQVTEGLERLYDYQHEDGGWGWWKTDPNDPFMTAYALDGLLDARAAGYKVDNGRQYRGHQALENLYAKYPRAVPDLKAYEAYVLERLVERDEQGQSAAGRRSTAATDRLEELWNARGRMSNYGRALLLLALQTAGDPRRAALAKELLSAVQVKGELAWWPAETDTLLYEPVDASVEATSLAVRALVANHAKAPVLEQAVRYLLANRNGGYYWSSTKQTAMVLYGLLDYMRARGEQALPFAVDVFVNDALVATREFTQADLTSPNPAVVTAPGLAGVNRVRLVKRGTGTLYWSAEAQYYQTGGAVAASGSRNLAISRLYFHLSPVQQKDRIIYRETPFVGTAQPGDVLLVRLTVAGASDWRHLMIQDPLPAGAEPIKQWWSYDLEKRVTWAPAAREYRDDRVVFFQQDFERGRYEYVYLLKVITPGSFRAMPAQIMPMYVPGVWASSDAQGVTFGALPK